jgi:hypothetical protein
VLLLVSLAPPVDFLDRPVPADVRDIYDAKGQRIVDGEIPYRDFSLEYPPGAVPAIALPAIGGGEYATRFRLLMWALAAGCVVLVAVGLAATGAGPLRLYGGPLAVALAALPLRQIFFDRYDLWPAFLAVAGLVAVALGRRGLGLAALGLGGAAKIFPLAIAPAALLFGRFDRRRDLLALVAGAAVVTLPFLLLGPGGIRFSVEEQARRPLQVETLGGSALLVAHQLGLYDATTESSYGSQNLDGALPDALAPLHSLAQLAAVALVALLFARGARGRPELFTAGAAAVAGFVAFGKVLSPQYLVWLAPLVPLVARRVWAPAVGLFYGAAVLTQLWFPDRYDELVRLGGVAWVALARNLLLVALFALLALNLGRTTRR